MAGPTHNRRNALSNIFIALFLLCIFTSTAQAASAVLGVDFGTEYIKATLVKPGIPLDIVLTKDSRRKETAAVAFKPIKDAVKGTFPERIYGSDAMALAARFPGEVFPNLKALLGLPSTNTKVQDYASSHPALQITEDITRGTVAFRSNAFDADEQPFLVEEILAMEFQSIQKNAEALAGKGSSVKDIVVTIPPFFGLEEKRAIKLAADLAGLRVLSLVSDGLAVGLNYATSRTFPSITEGGKPEHHLVFDMGAGSTKATVLRFQGRTVKDVGKFNKTIQEVQVMGTGWDRTLGGDALNAIIVDDMIASFVESKAAKAAKVEPEAVRKHGRAQAKLLKEAERLRHVLSANTETQGSFEGLYDEVDFKYKLTRANFEKLSESFVEKVYPAIETACDRAGLEIADLDSIILHGGAVRTPFIQKELEKIAGSAEKLRSNVNSDEAAVFGAGFRGAGLSPSFRVKDIRTSDAAGYTVGMNWTNIHDKPQHQALFTPQSSLGKEKTVSFQNQKDFPLDFYQHVPGGENVSPGSAEKRVLTLTTKNLTVSVAELKGQGCTDGDILAKVGVSLNTEDGEVQITKVVLHCELEEEEKKDSVVDSVKGLFGFGKKEGQDVLIDDSEQVEATGSDKPSSNSKTSTTTSAAASASGKEANSKLTKRLIAIPLDHELTVKGYPQLSSAEIKRMKDRLQAFDDSDRSRRLREEALNQLEGFTYRARDWIEDAAFIAASTVEERTSLDTLAKAAGEWIYGDGASATTAEFKAKLKALKDIVNPVEIRKSESNTRPAQIKALQDALDQTKSFIETVQDQIKVAAEAALSAASSSGSSSTATADATLSTDDFGDLDDEDTISSKTTTAPKPSYTPPPPPTYSESDITPVQEMYDTVSSWLAEKITQQDALPANADPVILAKDLATKASELNKAGMDLLMKGMKAPPKSKTSSSKSKTSKSKKAKQTKSARKDEKKRPNLEDLPEGMKIFSVNDDGSMPSEEEIREAINKQQKEDKHDEL